MSLHELGKSMCFSSSSKIFVNQIGGDGCALYLEIKHIDITTRHKNIGDIWDKHIVFLLVLNYLCGSDELFPTEA